MIFILSLTLISIYSIGVQKLAFGSRFMSLDFRNTHFRSYAYIGFKLGKDAKTVHGELVAVFNEDRSPNLRTIYGWFEDIRQDRFTLEKGTRPGRPRSVRTPSLIEKVEKMVGDDPRMSVRQLSDSLEVEMTSIYRVLTEELKLRSVCSVWVPTVLSEKNKRDRVDCCKRLISFLRGPVSDVYCVQDELWINWDAQKSKNQNKAWLKKGQKRLQVPKPKLTPKKTMFLIAFTCCPARFSVTALPKGTTVDAEYFVQFLKDTNNRFANLKRSNTKLKELTLQFDNARPHTAQRSQAYLTSSGITTIKQSPYSPDLNLCDRFLFTRLQEHCRSQQYTGSNEVEWDVKRFLRQLPETLLLHELEKLKRHCEEVVRQSGVYITS